jgi:hypothetical protein
MLHFCHAAGAEDVFVENGSGFSSIKQSGSKTAGVLFCVSGGRRPAKGKDFSLQGRFALE